MVDIVGIKVNLIWFWNVFFVGVIVGFGGVYFIFVLVL